MIDPTTGLLSLVGWERAVAAEEHRHRRYGAEEAAVLCVRVHGGDDGDGTGEPDEPALRQAASVLRVLARESDVVARVGAGEFSALLLRAGPEVVTPTRHRYERAFVDAGLDAVVGVVSAPPAATITAAWHHAMELINAMDGDASPA